MNVSSSARLIVEASPAETRAVLFDDQGRPAHLFLERWQGQDTALSYGQTYEAYVRAKRPALKGAFVETDAGTEAFLRLPRDQSVNEGQRVMVRVESEKRASKLARVCLAEVDDPARTATMSRFSVWCNQLPWAFEQETSVDQSEIDAAFESALSPSIPIPGGGNLWLETTRALVAIDIDSANRPERGRAAARALAINRDAVDVAARHLVLRRFAGLAVLDCVGPMTKTTGDEVRARFRDRLRYYSGEAAKVRGPSDLGLLQVSRPWRFSPIGDLLLDMHGAVSTESRLVDALRDVQRAAHAERTRFFELALGESLYSTYMARKSAGQIVFDEACSGRINIVRGTVLETEIRRL